MMMHCARVRDHGDADQLLLEQTPVPEPASGEVRVRLMASALNHLDLWVRKGVAGHRFPLPLIPGCDGAGIVEACGDGVADASDSNLVRMVFGFLRAGQRFDVFFKSLRSR
jgi:NADPH:quinone reductase-like Zn-dependent oxidoreductase